MKRAWIALAFGVVACGAPVAPVAAPAPAPVVGEEPKPASPVSLAHKDGAVVARDGDGRELYRIRADDDAIVREGYAPTPSWRVSLRLFPGGPNANPQRVFAVAADGSVLTGASDGSLVGIDAGGTPRFQLGVRGAVKGIVARPGGDFTVTTSAGVVVLGPGGEVRSEPAPPPRPALVFHAIRTSIPSMPGSVVVLAPSDAWALGKEELHHFDGKAWRRVEMPELHRLKNPILSGKEELVADRLERGAGGALLLIGTQLLWSKNAPALESGMLRVFERTGGSFRERRDLLPALAKTRQYLPSLMRSPPHAIGPGGREVFCEADACVARGLPPSFTPAGAAAPALVGKGPWSYFEWDDGGGWSQWKAIAFAGETLWRFGEKGLMRDGRVVPADLPDQPDGAVRDLWASGEDDVWALLGTGDESAVVLHWDGKTFSKSPSLVPYASTLSGSARNDVWLEGAGLAHFDGTTWRRIAGLPKGSLLPGSGKGEVLLHAADGFFRITPDPSPTPDLEGVTAPPPPAAPPSRPLAVGPVDPSFHLERVTIDVDGGAPLRSAIGVVEGPGGVVWMHDGHRVVELSGARARRIHEGPLACFRCAAPSGLGQGLVLTPGLRPVSAGRAADELVWLPALLSIARAPSGATWAVSANRDDVSPRAVVHDARGVRLVAGLPVASYADVAPRADDDVWFAGGLGVSWESTRPEGEGTLVQFDGRTFARHRAPDGALFSVVATAPAEAWAVGAGGGVVHAANAGVEAFHLVAEDGSRLPATLRAAAAGPGEVWIAGDRSTLLRWDGASLRRIDASVTGPDAALTAVVPPGAQPGWVVGPGGIWRIVRAR